MKKFGFALACLLAIAAPAAHADQLDLNVIDTNDCVRARDEIQLLNSSDAYVDAECSDFGSYPSSNGEVYNYRLYTMVSVPYSIGPGAVIRLNDIDTDDCEFAANEVRLLSSQRAYIDAECDGPGEFPSGDGHVYRFRVYSTITVNY